MLYKSFILPLLFYDTETGMLLKLPLEFWRDHYMLAKISAFELTMSCANSLMI